MEAKTLRQIGIFPHLGKPKAIELAHTTKAYLTERGVKSWVTPKVCQALGWAKDNSTVVAENPQNVGAVIVLGGDGTILHGAGFLAPYGVPLLGVNLGHLGFLTEVEPKDLESAVIKLLHGDFTIEKRMLLEAAVEDGKEKQRFFAVNDIVITRAAFARMVHVAIDIEGVAAGDFLADGLIVSTPTGSTAYSLSAGGPIVHPRLQTILITPICPHSLATRSILVPPEDELRIRIIDDRKADVLLTADGRPGAELKSAESIVVQRAKRCAHFIKLGERSFYEVLRNRLDYPSLHPPGKV